MTDRRFNAPLALGLFGIVVAIVVLLLLTLSGCEKPQTPETKLRRVFRGW